MPRLIGGELGDALFSFGELRVERCNERGDVNVVVLVDGERVAAFSMACGDARDLGAILIRKTSTA